jgi:endonuclease G, mitochondrial
MTVSDEERLARVTARVTARLNASPSLRAAIHQAASDGRLPDVLGSALAGVGGLDRVAHGDALESSLPPLALEAIVQRFGRPPLLVQNNEIQLVPLEDFPPATDTQIKGTEPLVRSVGRIAFVNHSMAWGGTGWVIKADGDKRVVATNRHVAKIVASRVSDGSGFFMRSPATGVRYGAEVDFTETLDRPPGAPEPVRVERVVYLADDLSPDVALLEIVGDALPSAFELAEDETGEGELVGLIGYPAFDTRNDAADQERYFRDLYDVKRYAPGRVMQPLASDRVFTHDCTSLGGNSGSPLLRLSDGKVVGLHFSGRYGVSNSAVGVSTLRQILDGNPPVGPFSRSGPTEARSDGTHEPDFFVGRLGYDPAFLGDGELLAPWPGLAQDVTDQLSTPTDGTQENPHEIRYTHYGVKYRSDRRQPLMTAVNIDGARSVSIKRTDDKWFLDKRIPLERQLTQVDYDDPEIDRGHLVRREDPNWGDDIVMGPDGPTSATATLANFDTFHYVNAALQTSKLNQGSKLWLGLETYLLESARTKGFKLSVFTGPVFRPDDPEVKPGLQAPLEFWKVAVMVDVETNRLHATAYLLSQGELIRDLLEKRSRNEAVEGFVLGEYRTFQVAVRDLAEATGYDLSTYAAADPLGGAADQEGVAEGVPVFVPLEALDGIVI